ncbi:hypothetical protein EUX98_g5574 [Antrodiella citrinella]|uniref:Reverse transcriptase domain-containing protein n=1 Tax=Antrodiella citrinella TaxID=2447956 RepID=A0A4V3XID2_9APHY|nr:hypothetical protein EUX98_g5574 [Antrodiella citrinella]
MSKELTENDVENALKKSKSGSAAGIDGATYDLWKTLNERYKEDERAEKPAFNIVKLLTAVFNDVERHGVDKDTGFADGWMCPIYKKNDRNEISNYRPITLLNTDYKLLTKALSVKLAEAAPTFFHENQAGFIPGRNIKDQTKLTRMIMEYAEATEHNGMIVALDQEKAYDKIAHNYLWWTLEAFEIPKNFIQTVRSLYEHASTKVMVNGHLSKSFHVERGVRQGDPLSCLLFDLAIEPLAEALRQSNPKGLKIPGSEERLIATLFADDTTTYLSEDDDFDALEAILDEWCIGIASRANFNVTKTEIIPIGTEAFREGLIETRTMKGLTNPIAANIHIVPDGENVRILGAWFGNKSELAAPWTPVSMKFSESSRKADD